MKKNRSIQAISLYPLIFLLIVIASCSLLLLRGSILFSILIFLQPFLYIISSELSLSLPFVKDEKERIAGVIVLFSGINLFVYIGAFVFTTFVPPVIEKSERSGSTLPNISAPKRSVPSLTPSTTPIRVNQTIKGTIIDMPWIEAEKRREIHIMENETIIRTRITDSTFMNYQGRRVYLDSFQVGDSVRAIYDDRNQLVNLNKE